MELAVSEISGRRYRIDEQQRSAVSGKTGHKQEFVVCYETRRPIARTEAEHCEVTGNPVRPGILARCEVTGKHVLPSELERCTATCRRVLKRLLVNSSLSEARILEDVAIRSLAGRYCAPAEALECFWSGRKTHPDDILACVLTGLPIHVEFTEPNGIARLSPLAELLDGVRRSADESSRWDNVAARIVSALKGGKCKVEAAVLSPAKKHLATCSEIRTLLGFRSNIVGTIYSIGEGVLVGRIAVGKRQGNIWRARS